MHQANRQKFGRGAASLIFICIIAQPACFAKGKVDVNTATCEEIAAGCWLRPDQAKRIVEYRDSHGPFSSVEDLIGIKNIGRTTVERIETDITVSDNLRCWNCGAVFKELRQHKKGICPICKIHWPASPEEMREKLVSNDKPRQMDGELPVKIGDQAKTVISTFGEQPRVGGPVMGAMNSHQKDLYGLVHYPYQSRGISFDFYRDRVWKIEVGLRYKGTLLGIRIGDGQDVIIRKCGSQSRYWGESRLEYDVLGGREVHFILDRATKTVTKIYLYDKRVHDMFLKKARRIYMR